MEEKFKKPKAILKKIRGLSLKARKIILWTVVLLVGLGLFYIWIQTSKQNLRSLQQNQAETSPLSFLGEEVRNQVSLGGQISSEKINQLRKVVEQYPEEFEQLVDDKKKNPEELKSLLRDSNLLREKLEEIKNQQ